MASKAEAPELEDLVERPFDGVTRLTGWLGEGPRGLVALPLALAAGLGLALPAVLARRGDHQRAAAVRQAGLLALGGAALDGALMAGLPLLDLSYAPLGPAVFNLLCGRTAIAGAATALALTLGRAGRDLSPAGRRRLGRALGGAHAAMSALIFYATYIEGQRLQTTRHALAFPGRTPGAPAARLRLAHLSDMHVERMTRRDHATVAALAAAQPDLVCLTGDFINIDYYDGPAFADLHTLLQAIVALQPRYGVYACLGNNDPPLPTQRVLQDSGVRLLNNNVERIDVGGRQVQVIGVRTGADACWEDDLPGFQKAVAQAEAQGPADLRLLLYHTPDMVPQAAAAGIDLYLCGHTHGGQIRLPFLGAARTGSRFGQRYVAGLHRLPNQGYIYTSRGTGFEGLHIPRMRVLCPPEVALFDITLG